MQDDIRIDIPDCVEMELCHRLVELQREVWGLSDLDIMPHEAMVKSWPARLAVEIPRTFGRMKEDDPQQAECIRLATRRIFCDLFKRGYAVRGFCEEGSRSFYLMSRQPPAP